jgi:hypothetical protein
VTVGDLFALARRHWVVSLLMAALLALGLSWAQHRHEAYDGQVAALLLAPVDSGQNALASTTTSLIATAGILSGVVNGPTTLPRTSGEQTLASSGVTLGWSARQPNHGGQWDNDFEDPFLDVRSTGPTIAASQAQMAVALNRISTALATIQDERSVPQAQRIRLVLNPSEPVYVKQSGSRTRTLGAVGVLGLLAWGSVLLVAERLRPRLVRPVPGLDPVRPAPRTRRRPAAVAAPDRPLQPRATAWPERT